MRLTGKMLASGGSKELRSGADFYPTPPEATQALLNFLRLPVRTWIYEPACGDGAIAKVCLENNLRVAASDLHARGYGTAGVDFLKKSPVPFRGWLITNPPFCLAEAFVRQALAYEGTSVAMLFKSQFWHAASRTKLFEETRPSHVLAMTFRPNFTRGERGKSPTMDALWTVWRAGREGRTEYNLLSKP